MFWYRLEWSDSPTHFTRGSGNLTNIGLVKIISSDVLTSLAWNLLIAGRPKNWRKRTRRIKCNRRRLRKNSLQVILFQHLNVKWIEAMDLINKCKIWGCPLWTSVHRQKNSQIKSITAIQRFKLKIKFSENIQFQPKLNNILLKARSYGFCLLMPEKSLVKLIKSIHPMRCQINKDLINHVR